MYVLPGSSDSGKKLSNTFFFLYLSMLRYYCNYEFRIMNYDLQIIAQSNYNLLRWLLRRGSPLPIPNREVKPACADGTAICGRVCHCLFLVKPRPKVEAFFFGGNVSAVGLYSPPSLIWTWFRFFLKTLSKSDRFFCCYKFLEKID